MNKFTTLLFLGMTLLVIWLILCLTNPWAGYIMTLTFFIALTGLIIFIFTCYALARRETKHVATHSKKRASILIPHLSEN